MKNIDIEFEQYLEDLTEEIVDAFTVRPDHKPPTPWTDFIMSRFTKIL